MVRHTSCPNGFDVVLKVVTIIFIDDYYLWDI